MSDLASHLALAKRLIVNIKEGISKLEEIETGNRAGDPSGLARDLQTKLNDLQRVSVEMDGMWSMALIHETASKREVWRRKVKGVAEELSELSLALGKYNGREIKRQVEEEQREELLSRSEAGRSAAALLDAEVAMAGSVSRSKRHLEEMYDMGTAVLSAMAGNRERLKATHRKMLDVLNSVGLGESLLRLIERRQRLYILITYTGMVAILLIVMLLIWWSWF